MSWLALIFLAATGTAANLAEPLADAERSQAAGLIEAMKTNPRGPYQGVSWFCNDGTVLPPEPYACATRGGGFQHGVLSREAEKLGAMGLHVGTLLAALTPDELLDHGAYRTRALVVEAYLERALGGWVLRLARAYRGFRQAEDEEKAARELLIALLQDKSFFAQRSLAVLLARAVPYGTSEVLADQVRALAGSLGDADPKGFGALRFKIHSMPEPSDMQAVQAYAESAPTSELAATARELLAAMQTDFSPETRRGRMKEIRRWLHDREAREKIDAFLAADLHDAPALVHAGSALVAAAERALRFGATPRQAEHNLLLLHTMDMVASTWVGATAELTRRPLARGEVLDLVRELVTSARGLGLLSAREHEASTEILGVMRTGELDAYAEDARALERVLEWARARLLSDLGMAIERYQAVEPRARSVIDDALRSGVMLPLAALLDRLSADVERLRGGGHELVGLDVAGGAWLRGENPGLAVGALNVIAAGDDPSRVGRRDVVLLPDLLPALPPVAGIITVGTAGSLSHLALLARNLGIPRASVGAELASVLAKHAGEPVVLGVSAGRRVLLGPLAALDPKTRALVQPSAVSAGSRLTVDAGRLDLSTTRIFELRDVSAAAIGVRVGSKAGELSELARLFPGRVAPARVIPFGAFVRHVDRPAPDGSPSPLARLRYAYALARRLGPEQGERAVLEELTRFREAIATLRYPEGFEAEIKSALASLGKPGTFGVFVRSDTNVEDLKEFVGAGLNLTVPNQVGLASVLKAIREVWASPFRERAFYWRQNLMTNPEHVYPSVLLHRTVPSEISGVMITADLDRGDPSAITISASEGVSAVVDGGSPETVLVDQDGKVHLLASSRTPTRKAISRPPREGVVMLPAEGRDPLLGPKELAELVRVAAEARARMPTSGEALPWDIEFGFVGGKAYLMQIRPLRTSKAAAHQPLLTQLDALARPASTSVDLAGLVP